jgi:glyoxylase-like metal-dependent hydrolase (beta-lactamase superfamily II)
MKTSEIIVKQLKVGGLDSNFSYLLYHAATGDAALIDPCGDVRIIENAVKACGKINPRYILLTHGHGDHTSGVNESLEFFPAPVLAHPFCSFPHVRDLQDREKLEFGNLYIEVLFSPGHSVDSVCYRLSNDSAVFTGDTLFIDCCGYCKPGKMFRTMREVLYPLADSNIVYSGHDYGHVPFAPLGEEKRTNPYLYIDNLDAFIDAVRKL